MTGHPTVELRRATTADLPAIEALLAAERLPTTDLATAPVALWVAVRDGLVIGAAGLERYGDAGLLRSVVVAPAARGTGLGIALAATVERAARADGLTSLTLLTQTAAEFFARLGFSAVERAVAPPALAASAEFRSLCPASARCLTKPLDAATRWVLFLCTGNSCRSILGEATFNHLAPAGWRAVSAGSRPTGYVHPRSLALLAREGIATAGTFSKSWEQLGVTPDVVLSVCGNAAGEACPAWLGPAIRAHWGVEDPAHVTGTEAEVEAAFATAYRTLRRRIEAMFALPPAVLSGDRAVLEAELARIGSEVH